MPLPQPRNLRDRLAAELPAKVAVLLGLAVGICVPYFGLQALATFPARSAPLTWLDHVVAFDPRWLIAYGSIAVLVPLFPLLAARRDELRRYSVGLALLCVACFTFFLLLPVAGPRPEIAPDHDSYRLMVRVDASTNSLPSLHAGLTAYSFLFGYRILRRSLTARGRRVFLVGACTWAAAILYATLATKQHQVVDLPPGILLAWLAHRRAWRGSA